MQTAYFFKNMQQSESELLLNYMEKKLPRLERLLKRHAPETVRLHISGEHFDKHSAYNVELKLQVGSEDYVGSEASHTINKAIDLSVDRLEMQLKRASALMRRTHRTPKLRRALKQAVIMSA